MTKAFSIELLDGTYFSLEGFTGEFTYENINKYYGEEVAKKIFDACEYRIFNGL